MKKSCLIIFILLMAILVGCGEEKGKKRKSSAEYYCFRYPDEEAPLTITQIEIHDEEYDVFGIHLGDNIEEGIDILKDYGYKREDFPVDNTYLYTKGDVNVILDYDGDTITEIVASLSTDTEAGVMY